MKFLFNLEIFDLISLNFYSMTDYDHGTCVGFVGACLLAQIGLAIENNDSRLSFIPKAEFVRVLSGIVNSGAEVPNGSGGADSADFTALDGDPDPAAASRSRSDRAKQVTSSKSY